MADNQIVCSTCGTRYTAPASGPPFCPNNNCPRHVSLTPGAGSLRAAAADAMREVEVWDIAVKQAEEALAEARTAAQAARERVTASLAEAQKQAEAELSELKSLRHRA